MRSAVLTAKQAIKTINQAGSPLGAEVLISGSGPIGALVLVAAKLAGANPSQ